MNRVEGRSSGHLAKADPKRRRWQPIGERVQIARVAPPTLNGAQSAS